MRFDIACVNVSRPILVVLDYYKKYVSLTKGLP